MFPLFFFLFLFHLKSFYSLNIVMVESHQLGYLCSHAIEQERDLKKKKNLRENSEYIQ